MLLSKINRRSVEAFTSLQRKVMVSIFHLLCLTLIHAQKIDYCQYFYMDISFREENSEMIKSYSPEIRQHPQDEFSDFAQQHSNRFSYLLWNKLGDLGPVAEIYPDSTSMDLAFCNLIRNNKPFRLYLDNLIPVALRDQHINADTFSVDELMLVASRFFYCIEIQESDTVIISHICVSLNEEEFIPYKRDLTLLEAFAFEGIFHSLMNEEKPKFDANFKRYVNETTDRYKDIADSFDELLVSVRHECFALMEDDEDLKNSLLNYYAANRDNLNFIVNGSNY